MLVFSQSKEQSSLTPFSSFLILILQNTHSKQSINKKVTTTRKRVA